MNTTKRNRNHVAADHISKPVKGHRATPHAAQRYLISDGLSRGNEIFHLPLEAWVWLEAGIKLEINICSRNLRFNG